MDSDEKVLPPEVNLVCFEKPELITYKTQTETKQTKSTKTEDCLLPSGNKNKNDGVKHKCRDVLDRIITPRELEMDGKVYRVKVSSQPAYKIDTKKLTEMVDKCLEKFANDENMCLNKEELYFQCFNESIRQMTVKCAEKGNLMVRIRDDMKISIDGYRKLYESVTAKEIRKALQMKQKKSDMEEMVQELTSDNKKLVVELAETIAMTKKNEREIVEAREAEAKLLAKDLADMKKKSEQAKDAIKDFFLQKK